MIVYEEGRLDLKHGLTGLEMLDFMKQLWLIKFVSAITIVLCLPSYFLFRST